MCYKRSKKKLNSKKEECKLVQVLNMSKGITTWPPGRDTSPLAFPHHAPQIINK